MPNQSGSAWVLNFGYKYQSVTVSDTRELDENYSSVETRNHNRLLVQFGFEFLRQTICGKRFAANVLTFNGSS
ncbi:MAG: hypothetical protein QMB03_02865 [Spirosomataceae bacterium]